MKDLENYLEEAIDNIHNDRDVTSALLKDVMQLLSESDIHHEKVGPIAAKYVETLQRSNEQLFKVIAILQKKESKSENLSEKDKEELFDLIQKGK